MGAAMQGTIDLLILKKNDLELSILRDTTTKNLKHKYFSDMLSSVRSRFSAEKSVIRNKIQNLDTKQSRDEYKALLAELNELSDEEEQETKTMEAEMTDFENTQQAKIDQEQTELEDIKADLQTYQETNKNNAKEDFNYANA